MTTLSVCIATHKRAPRLAALLGDLCRQTQLPDQVVVVDNDPAGSAGPVILALRELACPFAIHYEIQPVKNISTTRNRTVAAAHGDWLAFIDDDERAAPDWLERLLDSALRYGADGVIAPVVPELPANAPGWIRRGHFYDWARLASGTVTSPQLLRFGNLVLHRSLLARLSGPFDPAYGLTGGEDGDLLLRAVANGARLVWCDDALVFEPVEAQRLRLRWLSLRALRGGQDFARHRRAGRMGRFDAAAELHFLCDAFGKGVLAILLSLLLLPLSRHRSAHWWLRACANAGKLSIFLGMHYREYGPQK